MLPAGMLAVGSASVPCWGGSCRCSCGCCSSLPSFSLVFKLFSASWRTGCSGFSCSSSASAADVFQPGVISPDTRSNSPCTSSFSATFRSISTFSISIRSSWGAIVSSFVVSEATTSASGVIKFVVVFCVLFSREIR
ncbi:hypothetical protein PFISCL1PPCAC_25804 [Pristionchus fissidentatus]|uniref:Secreted protein n=1 Tax=Pristionchus fissidentatus TaxID=1538716 RepID=A0AAV5WR67_9BILA|nr:hypothetical protein PFISCL1PPCAC_25804 [Pristionchus fissidentatus]